MITVLVIVTLVLIAIASLLYFFKPKPKPKNDDGDGDGDKKPKIPQFAKDWWGKKGDEGKRFIWYIVVITVAYIAGYIAPDGKEAIFRGVVALVGVHIIWTFLSNGKIGTFTWTVVLGMVTYFVLAWGYPNDAPRIFDASWGLSKKIMTNIADTAQSINDNHGKAETSQSVEQTAVAKAVVTSVQLTIPVDETVFVAPPHGYRLSSALCPPENVMEVTGNHDEVLRQVDCAGRITLEEAELYGRKFAFFQKQGASQPSVVIVRWVKIS